MLTGHLRKRPWRLRACHNLRRPYNILILMSDQHSKHYLGCYGNTLVRTPHLDRLAAQGHALRRRLLPLAALRAQPHVLSDGAYAFR